MVSQLKDSGADFRYTEEQAARFRKHGWWGDEILLDHLDRWATETPGFELATDGTGRLTYGEARGQAYRLAASLRRLGVQRGDRVLVQLPNWNEFIVIYLAAIRAGAVLVPIMPIYRHDEIGYILERSQARVAFTAGEFRKFDHLQMFRELRAKSPELRELVVVRGEAGANEQSIDRLTEPNRRADDFDEPAIGPRPTADDGHVLIFTSGTEARPKGCFHTWNTIGFSVRGLAKAFELDRGCVTFAPSPVSHGTGLAMGVAVPILTGGSIHLQDVWQPKEGLARIREHRCTHAATATPFVRMALDAFDPAVDDVSSMRMWICAGAPIPADLATEVEEHLLTHPKVKAVAVVAMPDRLMGEKACAFVVPDGDEAPTLAELGDYLKNTRRIAVHKIPERVEIVKELPMTPSGKIQKFALRDQARRMVEIATS